VAASQGQVKAIFMIVAMEGLIPTVAPAPRKTIPAPPLSRPNLYPAQEEDEPGIAARETTPRPSKSVAANHFGSLETTPPAHQTHASFYASDTRIPFAQHR
jgi:hypothetical protein